MIIRYRGGNNTVKQYQKTSYIDQNDKTKSGVDSICNNFPVKIDKV
jgi:hypothetical protein